MKIIAIKGKNLASLEGEFEVDFTVEPLRSAGIFAITGQTGSGKSTLLDALCLALFDETPRNNRTTESISIIDVRDKTINQKDSRNILRRGTSDGYAEVDFVSLGGETFRSRWSVRRSRDKVDGSLQSTDFKLTNLSTNVELQGRKTELLAKVVELIGLTFDQFTRAVLLAQGDFATFLKATQREKAELLEKLTGTDIYSRISSSIYEKTKSAEQDLALINERIKDIELLSVEELEAITAEKQTIVTEMELLKSQLVELTTKIRWIAEQGILIDSIEQGRKMLEEAQIALEYAKPRYDYLNRIDSVQEIRDNHTVLKSTAKGLIENRANLAKQESEREVNGLLLTQAMEKMIACEAEQKQQFELVTAMEPMVRQARALDIHLESAKTSLGEARAACEQTALSKSKTMKAIETTQATIKAVGQKIERIAVWLAANEPCKELVPKVDLIVNLLNDATIAKKQGSNNAKTLLESERVIGSDRQQLSELKMEAERLNTLLPTEIVTLRANLTEGAPCPVCGSLHHPMSSVKGESLDEAKLNQAKLQANDKIIALSTAVERRQNEHIRLQSVIDSYATQSQEAITKLTTYLKDWPEWEQRLEEGTLQRSLCDIAETWNIYIADQVKANEQITNLQTTLRLEQSSLEEIIQTLTSKEQKRQTYQGELEKLKTQRVEILSGRSADEVEHDYLKKNKEIAERLTQLVTKRGEFVSKNEKYAGAISQISEDFIRLTQQHCNAQLSVDKWIETKNGTITLEQLTDLLSKDNRWLAIERETLDRLRESKTTMQATLSERQKNLDRHYDAEVKPTAEESMEGLQFLLLDKNRQCEPKSKRNTEIEMLLTNHARGSVKLKTYEKELEEKRILAENWKKLNEMFGSADGSKFKVLAQGYTLDALLTYANKHLHELSKRYELLRIPNTLALQVVDLDMLGEVRTVHSLSGGESFLISLALALGLSSLSSNSMNVESLFIDEGFGSLDIDTLRVAMDALESLQTQGRKIGVISHVAEMTERITTQIRVVKTVNGRSKIEVI